MGTLSERTAVGALSVRTTAKAETPGITSLTIRPARAYRWGEDGLAGISDDRQSLCFALALWNEKDPILKERLFGLSNSEGNHGEDVKEYYFYLDSTPTHSYMKYLYKYPQAAFPYNDLIATNRERGQAIRSMSCSTRACSTRTVILMSSWNTPKPRRRNCSFRSPFITAGRKRRRSSCCPPSGFGMTGRGEMIKVASNLRSPQPSPAGSG